MSKNRDVFRSNPDTTPAPIPPPVAYSSSQESSAGALVAGIVIIGGGAFAGLYLLRDKLPEPLYTPMQNFSNWLASVLKTNNNGGGCASDSDCASGQTCFDGTCVGGGCTNDGDCASGQVCSKGNCVWNQGDFVGTIVNAITNAPISGATIKIVSASNPSFVKTTVSDANGDWKILNIPLGNYDYYASANCYEDYGPKRYILTMPYNSMQKPQVLIDGSLYGQGYEIFKVDGIWGGSKTFNLCRPRSVQSIAAQSGMKCSFMNESKIILRAYATDGTEIYVGDFYEKCGLPSDNKDDRQTIGGATDNRGVPLINYGPISKIVVTKDLTNIVHDLNVTVQYPTTR